MNCDSIVLNIASKITFNLCFWHQQRLFKNLSNLVFSNKTKRGILRMPLFVLLLFRKYYLQFYTSTAAFLGRPLRGFGSPSVTGGVSLSVAVLAVFVVALFIA